MRRPEQKRPTSARSQYLLGRPERVRCFRRAHLKQLFERHAQKSECRCIDEMGRLHERKRALGKRGERRTQKPHLAHSRLLDQQIHERPERPTAAGQLGRKRGVARIDRAHTAPSQLGSAPKGRMHVLGMNDCNRHRDSVKYDKTCMYIQYPTRFRGNPKSHFLLPRTGPRRSAHLSSSSHGIVHTLAVHP